MTNRRLRLSLAAVAFLVAVVCTMQAVVATVTGGGS